MRIISGIYGGRRFDTPKNLQARPTTDLAKGALFNILTNRIDFEGISALDLFAGTGSISFEFVSRGAKKVISIEKNTIQQNYIQSIHNQLKLGNEHCLFRTDVFRYLKNCNEKFDLIFADPPYDLPEIEQLPQTILKSKLLKDDGIFIMEHGKKNDFSSLPEFIEMRTYGAVHFSFFHHISR